MDLLLIFLLHPFRSLQRDDVLLFVEMLHLELIAELEDLFGFALPLWNSGHL